MKTEVAAYCRVSTKKDDQLNSLDNQKQYFENHVASDANLELYNVYYDSLSATKWEKREQFKQMLYDAGLDIELSKKGNLTIEIGNREPKFSRILVKDVSRFARNILSVDIIRKLRDIKVYIDFTNMNMSTEKMSEDMMLGMFMLFAERESKDRSEKTLWGNERSAEKGRIRTADIFYGYKYIKETNDLEIIEEEAEVIRACFNLYNSGEGFRRILNYLSGPKNEFGRVIVTRKGKPFSQTTLKRMISNPAYKGWLIRNKMDSPLVFTNKKFATPKDESKWITHKGRIPAIVTEEVFDQAQSIRGSKVNHKNRVGLKVQKGEYAGLVFCKKCGAAYTRNGERRSNRVFYNCRTKKTQGVAVCSSPNVNLEWIDWALDHFSQDGINDTIADFKGLYIGELIVFKDELFKRIDNQKSDEAELLRLKIGELEEQKKRMIKLYAAGKYEEDELNQITKEIEDEILLLEKNHNELSASNEEIQKEINEVEKVINDINDFKTGIKYSLDDLVDLLSAIRVSAADGSINATTGEEKQEKLYIFEFEFKIFNNLNEIVKKYSDLKIVRVENSISIFLPLHLTK